MSQNALFRAASAGDTHAREELEKLTGVVDDEQHWTILHRESWEGNASHVEFLVNEFGNKNLLVKVDTSGQTALHLAAQRGHVEVVEVLIEAARSLPYKPVSALSALVRHATDWKSGSARRLPGSSAEDSHCKAVSAEFLAFVRHANNWKNTALHRAVQFGHLAIVIRLVKADRTDRHIQNSIGQTPLFLAAILGKHDMVKMICSFCTAPSLDGPDDTTALHAAILSLPRVWKQNLLEANSIATDAFKELIYAAKRSSNSEDASHDSFEAILDKTFEEMTILDMVVKRNYTEGAELILAEHPAYKRERGGAGPSNHFSDLINIASNLGYREMVILLSKTYEILNATEKGQTEITNVGLHAFVVAIKSRSRDFVVRLLEENPAVVTYIDKDGWKPLHHAVFQEFDSILEVLIKAHDRINEQISDDDRIKAFAIAICDANTSSTLFQLIKLLRGDEPYPVINIHGENILHLAVCHFKKEMIQCILKYCPREHVDTMLNQQDADGNTPLHLLIWAGCFVPELIKHKSCQKVVQNRSAWTQADMLYHSDDIMVDQVQIKEALDEIQESKRSWIWCWRKPDTTDSPVTKERRSKKDAKFKKAKKELIAQRREEMKKEVERYRSRTNTQIIVTALITTVTFTVGFTMPGGYHQSGEPDQGLILLSKRKAFKTFMVSDALALALSITSLFIYFISSMYDDPARVKGFDIASTVLNIISVVAMMLTFIAGTYVVLAHSHGLAVTVSIISSMFFLAIIFLLANMALDRYRGKKLKV